MTDDLRLPEKQSITTWVFNPFHYVAGGLSLAIGLPIVVIASLNGALSGSHFDGVLDLHSGLLTPWWFYVAEGLINWLAAGSVLLGMGLLISKSKVRAIDVFGTQALARVPTLVSAVLIMSESIRAVPLALLTGQHIAPGSLAIFIMVSFGVLAMLIWMLILMYRGFATSCNVSGAKALCTFVVGVVVAETVSKVALIVVLYPLVR